MNSLQAIFLGAVQGITEFFPISSSGHLILLPRFFGWPKHTLAFDAVLHLGTGLALLFYFWRDWLAMLRSLLSDIKQIKTTNYEQQTTNYKFSRDSTCFLLIILASIPAGLAGLIFNDFVEARLRSPQIVVVALFVVAVLMLLAEKWRSYPTCKSPALTDALIIGFSQVLALVPGVSRSGITMTTGMFCGLTPEESARFSFLIAMPVVLAAGFWGLFSFSSLVTNYLLLVTGFLSSFLTGLLAIKFFLKLVERWGLWPFAVYRIFLAIFIFVVGL